MKGSSLTSCRSCGRFTRTHEPHCSFCGEALVVPRSKVSTVAKWGIAATVSMLSVGTVMGCAYGAPPSCTKSGCATGYVCNTQTGSCESKNSEKTGSETVTTDGGSTDGGSTE